MFPARFLLCILATGVYSGNVQTPKELKFLCDDDSGTITIPRVNIAEVKSVYAIGKKLGINDSCDVRETSENFTISACSLDNPVTIYTMFMPKQGAGNNVIIIGGRGNEAYILECFKETMVGDNTKLLSAIQVEKKLNISPQNKNAVSEFSVYLEMSIWIDENTKYSNGAVIHAGDQLTVLISGPAGPAYSVKKCIAYRPSQQSITIDLMGQSHIEPGILMTDFDQNFLTLPKMSDACYGKFCIKSTLYAFHFKEDNEVTIECTIEACKDYLSNCSPDKGFTVRTTTVQTGHQNGHRRRRDSNSNRHLLTSTIVVNDRLGSNEFQEINNGNIQELSYYITGTLVILWGSSRFV